MDNKVYVKNLVGYGESGFQWDIINTDEYSKLWDGHYRTDKNGNGLWSCGDVEDHQMTGTCQFNSSNNIKTTYSRIRRYFLL